MTSKSSTALQVWIYRNNAATRITILLMISYVRIVRIYLYLWYLWKHATSLNAVLCAVMKPVLLPIHFFYARSGGEGHHIHLHRQ